MHGISLYIFDRCLEVILSRDGCLKSLLALFSMHFLTATTAQSSPTARYCKVGHISAKVYIDWKWKDVYDGDWLGRCN